MLAVDTGAQGAYLTPIGQKYWRQFQELGIQDKLPLEEYIALAGNRQFVERAELLLMGRAAYQLKSVFPSYPAERFFGMPCVPPMLRNWHNHFDNYGNFMPGYCGGVSLGDWRNLNNLLAEGIDREAKPVLQFLASDDMAGLFRLAQGCGYPESGKGYVSKCDLCLDIRSHLVSRGDFQELRPKEFYEYGVGVNGS